uniref:Splicing factor, proline-and glutamine-rich n=2 Tax=Rhipicephalus TaxID=426455 RepID=A0A131YKX9_RHIAP
MSFHDNTEPRQQRPPIYRPKDPPPDVALDRSRIYIGNLPHTVTEDDVRELVEPYGAVRDVFVNSQKGFAFVKMDSPQSAEAVVTNLDMNLRRGRRLRVTPASNAKGKLAKALGQGGGAVRPRDEKPGGRCRLFVGNLPASTGEEELRRLFSEHGEVQETFLNSEKGFGFVKMASYEAAEAAKAALDDALVDGRRIQVRFATQGTCLSVRNLGPWVSNELLESAFSLFGEVERAVVIVDDRGRSVGEGIVEFARKPAAQAALKRCLEGCFLLTSEPRPVYAEPLEYRDWVLGLPERTVSRRGRGYARERELGPRFARPGTQEHRVAERWKRFLDFEKDKREELEKVLNEERRKLEEEVERFRREQVLERPFPPWQDGPHDQYASYLGYDTGYLGYPPQYGAGWNHRSPY